jgi:plastocyanin
MRALTSAVLAAILIGTAATAAPPTATIVIDKKAFGPAPTGLRVGQTLVWDNRDYLQHSATDKAGGFDLVLKPHSKGQMKLTRAGKITVYCRYHPGMTLTLDVVK